MDEIVEKRVKWIEYKGVEIMINDYTNLSGEEFIKTIQTLTENFVSLDKKDALLLIDIRDSYTNKDIVEAFNIGGKAIKPFTKKTAVLGVTGVKKILLNVVNKLSNIGAKPFTTEEEAKDWLIS